MGKGIFITATSTGVGKTVVAAAIIAALRASGVDACGMKPVETGCAEDDMGELVPADGMMLYEASERVEPLSAVTPLRYAEPLAPLVAERIERRNPDYGIMLGEFRRMLALHEAVVVEGVGGLLVPISEGYHVRDLAVDMALPVLVVASASLGTINHTLLTLEALRAVCLECAGVVVNFHGENTGSRAEETNAVILAELCGVPVLGEFPHAPGADIAGLARAAQEHLDMAAIRAMVS